MSLAPRAITVGGVPRRFLVAEPRGGATAILLSLHGTRSSAEGQARLSRMASLADADGAVVAFPQAILPIGRGYVWDHDGDTPFLAGLVAELSSRYPAADGRVCLTGMSGGARMSCHFASIHADQVLMVGAVAGLRAPERPPPRPVPVVAFHGTADRINPYAGGGGDRWDESVPEAAGRWAAANGLDAEAAEVAVSDTLTRTTYGPEGGPGEVTLWTSRGAGHTWPGTRLGLLLRLVLGRTSTEVDATREIWSFARRRRAT